MNKSKAEGIAFKHNLHTENPNLYQIIAAMEEYAQSRLQSVSEEVGNIDEVSHDMPDEMWEEIKGDKDKITETIRIAVLLTKWEAKEIINKYIKIKNERSR